MMGATNQITSDGYVFFQCLKLNLRKIWTQQKKHLPRPVPHQIFFRPAIAARQI